MRIELNVTDDNGRKIVAVDTVERAQQVPEAVLRLGWSAHDLLLGKPNAESRAFDLGTPTQRTPG